MLHHTHFAAEAQKGEKHIKWTQGYITKSCIQDLNPGPFDCRVFPHCIPLTSFENNIQGHNNNNGDRCDSKESDLTSTLSSLIQVTINH